MTPPFDHAAVGWTDATRATIVPSPASVRYAYWNASLVPQISAPCPRTTKLAPSKVVVPAPPTAPTSVFCQPSGKGVGGSGGSGLSGNTETPSNEAVLSVELT